MALPNVVDVLNEAICILNAEENVRKHYASEIKALEQRKDAISHDTYRIGVVGVTSSGKSTMINSLMGKSILPSRVRPSSSQLVRCHYDERNHAVVFFDDGSYIKLEGDDFNSERISLFADETFNPGNKERVREIEICTSCFPLGQDVVLIDSPGLDAYGYEGHEKLTMASLLPTVDACVLVTTCKTNSDQKLLSVLNAIAGSSSAGMPVILVQNMIDSIMPSPDGVKSKNDVARDHQTRLERIINSSAIAEKTQVSIVQYSAQWALEGRVSGSSSKSVLLDQSNYHKLVDAIIGTVERISPRVNNNRLQRVKKEIDRIKEDAFSDVGVKTVPIKESFEYEGYKDGIEATISDARNTSNGFIHDFDALRGKYESQNVCSQRTVEDVTSQVSAIEDSLIDLMRFLENKFESECKDLNIEMRDLWTPTSLKSARTPYLHQVTVTEKVKQKGFVGWLKRVNPFSGADSGYKTVTHTETDNQATKEHIISFLSSSEHIIKETTKKWWSRLHEVKNKLFAEIDLRREAFEARKSILLESQQYLTVANELTNLSRRISRVTIQTTENVVKAVKRPEDLLVEYECSSEVFSVYSFAELIKSHIHLSTINCFIEESPKSYVVLGWDRFSESDIIHKYFGITVSDEDITDGINTINNKLSLVHLPGQIDEKALVGRHSVFILVNATQIGAAEKQISNWVCSHILDIGSRLYFVIQDLAEVITAKDVIGVLSELKFFVEKEFSEYKSAILVVHHNPIYNLAITSIQSENTSLLVDRVNLVDDLNSCFGFLFEDETRTVIHDMINVYYS